MSTSAKQFQADKTQQTRSSGKTTEFLNDRGCQARCWGTRPQRTKKGQQTQQLKETLASKPTSEEPTLKGNVPVRNLLSQTMNKSNKSQQTHWPGPSNHIKPTNFGQPPRYETSSTECNLCAGLQALLREHLCWQHSESSLWARWWRMGILTICSCSRNPNGTSAQPSIHATTHTHTQTKLLFATPKATINKHNKLSPGCLVGGSDRGSSPRPQHVLLIRVGHHKVPPILGWHIFLQRGWLALGISPPKRGLRFASTIIPLTMNL